MRAHDLPLLARSRVFNRPLVITADKAMEIVAVLRERLNVSEVQVPALEAVYSADDLDGMAVQAAARTQGERRRTFDMIDGGIAVIPIIGTLVNKLGSIDPYSGMTGYDGISVKLQDALIDPEVQGIAFDIESGGGEVAGCFDLVDEIHAARSEKPIWSILTEYAASAAYAIASATDRIIMPRTGMVGSVGVVCMHVDWSEFLSKEGVKVTFIHAGKHKVDGNPYEQLPDDVREKIQEEVDAVRRIFVASVARGRDMPEAAVFETEAQMYQGETGLAAGLADAIMAPREAMEAFRAHIEGRDEVVAATALAGSTRSNEEQTMERSRVYATAAEGGTSKPSKAAEGEQTSEEQETQANDDEEREDEKEMEESDADAGEDTAAASAAAAFAATNPAAAEFLRRQGSDAEHTRLMQMDQLAEPGEGELLAQFKADRSMGVAAAALAFAEQRKQRRAGRQAARQDDAPQAQPTAAPDADGKVASGKGTPRQKAEDGIDREAKKIQAAERITYEQAYVKACEQNPELYKVLRAA
ncbi:S49 family peptidase [Pelagibius sp.]|uniref:S49 family peptidase n=1 Tax=Pelagibius sp. TaxID=1931238 RepID=UPI00262D53B1|nr:S49 family peptidase [Pelagibius sp.]